MFTNYLDGEIRDRAFIFYLVGFSLRLHNIDISKPFAFLKPTVALGIFIAIALLRTTLAFSGLEHIMNLKTILTILFKINEIAGVYAVWFCIDKVTSQIVATNWYARFGKCSFFIYAFHAPLINYISEYCLIKNIYAHPAAHLLLYVVLPVLVVFIIVNAEHLVKIYCPKFFLLVTGGRGADMLQTIALVQSSTEQRVQFGKLRRLYTALINELKTMHNYICSSQLQKRYKHNIIG
jgi:fucose 4-O-acetylase-like acetyltransferase